MPVKKVTQKDILLSIKEGQENMAKTHLDFASSVSTFMNDQDHINNKVLGYLENNSKTNTKGIVQLANDNKVRLDKKDKVDAVRVGKAGLISVAAGFIGGVIIFLAKSLMK